MMHTAKLSSNKYNNKQPWEKYHLHEHLNFI